MKNFFTKIQNYAIGASRSAFRAMHVLPNRLNRSKVLATYPAFFSGIKESLCCLEDEQSREVQKHLVYLAGKANVSVDDILSGRKLDVDQQIIIDAVTNIKKARTACGKNLSIAKRANSIMELAESRLDGWCSHEKSMAIFDYVVENKPCLCVEIGVFGGRSLIPCAAGLLLNGKGRIYGIETWSHDVAIEHKTNAENDEWWRNVNMSKVKNDFYRFIADNKLTDHVSIIEAPSSHAAMLFSEIDYLHIDGAHSIWSAVEDVMLYSGKVKVNGCIILDDVNWDGVNVAMRLLDAFCEKTHSFYNSNGVESCAIFRKHSHT
jgi:hypothetical protein